MNNVRSLIIIIVLIGIAIMPLYRYFQYNYLLDKIALKDNVAVEKILKHNCFNLNKKGGRLPWKYVPGFDEDNSPLEMACKTGNGKAVKILIDHGADASFIQPYHLTLLYLAMEKTEKSDYETIKTLVENGANPEEMLNNSSDRISCFQQCAFMDCGDYYYNINLSLYDDACYNEKAYQKRKYDIEKAKMILEIYRYLESVAEYNDMYYDTYGSPLMGAVGAQNMELIRYLLDTKAFDINEKNSRGETCVFGLLGNNCYDKEWKQETLALLIRYGIELDIKNNDGKTVKDLAEERGDLFFVELLEKFY